MPKKNLTVVLFLYICAAFPISAASVSFLVIETGLPPGTPEHQYSVLWENNLLDIFFDSEHIVSNSPLLRLSEKPTDDFPEEAGNAFNEARKGGMEFFIIAVVEHPENNVSMRLFNTESRYMIRKQEYTRIIPSTAREERENIRNAIRVMVARLN